MYSILNNILTNYGFTRSGVRQWHKNNLKVWVVTTSDGYEIRSREIGQELKIFPSIVKIIEELL